MKGAEDDHRDAKRMKTALNPLLLDLVLENVMTRITDVQTLLSVRLVCKSWESEASKVFRQVTQTSIHTIVTAYPDGLGWSNGTYNTPYPVTPVENIRLTGTCDYSTNPTVIRWFKASGAHVKALHFTSSLACYHQIRFLECVFKHWCPNLRVIKFTQVNCITTLNHLSRFTSNPFVCDIQQVTVSSSPDTIPSQDCPALQRSFLDSTISAFDFTNFKTDGGVMGNIFKHCNVKKLILEDFVAEHSDALILSLYRFDTNTMKSLTHFEYSSCLFIWGWQLDNFRKIQFPLKTLSFGSLTNRLGSSEMTLLLSSLSDTLEELEFNGTVNVFDWEDDDDEPEYIDVSIPHLSKLKRFKNSNVFCTRVGGLDFISNLPSLKSCELVCPTSGSSVYPLTPTQVFNLLFQSASFSSPHHLEHLKLDGKIVYERYVSMMSGWFPELSTVNLTLDGTDVFVEFLTHMKAFKLKIVKLFVFVNDHAWANTAVSSFLPSFKHLKELELIQLSDGPLNLTESTFENGFSRAPSLRMLKLENISVYSDELKRIEKSLHHIPEVKFSSLVLQTKPFDCELVNGSFNTNSCFQ